MQVEVARAQRLELPIHASVVVSLVFGERPDLLVQPAAHLAPITIAVTSATPAPNPTGRSTRGLRYHRSTSSSASSRSTCASSSCALHALAKLTLTVASVMSC